MMRPSELDRSMSDGYALLLTLAVLTTMSLLLLTFAADVDVNTRAASTLLRSQQEAQEALGAARRVAAELVPLGTEDTTGSLWLVRGEQLGAWYVDPLSWSVARDEPERQDQGLWRVEVAAEDAKFPLQRATAAILVELGMTPTVAESIEALRPQDGFTVLEELLRVPGLGGLKGAEDRPGPADRLTTFGPGLIWVNGAAREVLQAIPAVDPDVALSIRARLEAGERFEQLEHIGRAPGVTPETLATLSEWLTFVPGVYRLGVQRQDTAAPLVELVVQLIGDVPRVIRTRGAARP